jgi:hypothetical protein
MLMVSLFRTPVLFERKEGAMYVKFPRCIVTDISTSEDGGPQYLTVLEPGGGEYNLTARPNDPQYPCDAAARLQPFADSFAPCEIEAEISGFISHKDGIRRLFLSVRQLSVKPVKVEAPPVK